MPPPPARGVGGQRRPLVRARAASTAAVEAATQARPDRRGGTPAVATVAAMRSTLPPPTAREKGRVHERIVEDEVALCRLDHAA